MVCRPNKSRKRATRHAIKRLAEAGANTLGVVVNDVDFRKGDMLSNYSYRDTHYNYREVRRRRTHASEPAPSRPARPSRAPPGDGGARTCT
jgi:Mrp family chromosome partitioning ATPase